MTGNSWLDAATPARAAPDIDPERPEIARVYDYWLGGSTNFAADRRLGRAAIAAYPGIREGVLAQRAFLRRAVRYLAAEMGIRQFLDIGTGIPSASNTHEVAQAVTPECRVFYVDNNPIVLAHARALLAGGAGPTAFQDADVRDTGKVLREARRLLDFSQPVAVLLIGILQLIPDDDDPWAIVRRLVEAVPPGSWLAIVQPTKDVLADQMAKMEDRMNQHGGTQTTMRGHADILRFFAGTELVPPGLVQVHRWHPDSGTDITITIPAYGGLGQKP